MFYPWIEPIFVDSKAADGHPFDDLDGKLQLSNLQLNESPEWKRYSEISFGVDLNDGDKPIKDLLKLSQNNLADCSVVASLLSIIAYEERTGKFILRNNIYKDSSNSGKYIIKLFFNGIARRVIIDDYLPVSSITNNPLFIHDHDSQLPAWPALIEKAYMKVMGGYNFEGSHSASDTYALTGWIPEYILLRDYFENTNASIDILWERLYDGWNEGNLLICVGTGKLTKQESESLGIYGLHDYAVLDLQERDGEKNMLIRNPWKDGTAGANLPSLFWMPLRTVCNRFESLYLNWNLNGYSQGVPIHLLYRTQALITSSIESLSNSFLYNPQYKISNDTNEEVKVVLLLTRHLTTIDKNDVCYLSMLVYSNDYRIAIPDESKLVTKSPARNTSYCRLQFSIPPKSNYTIVIQCDKGSNATFESAEKFTLKAYTTSPRALALVKSPDEFPYKAEEKGQWTKFQSGGNWALKNYCDNPQYKLKIGPNGSTPATTKLYLQSDSNDPINIQVLWGRGKYMQIISDKDVIQSSGKYRTGICSTELKDLDDGEYTIIISMYEEGTIGNFLLYANGTSPVSLTKLISEKVSLFTRDVSIPWDGANQRQTFASVPRKSRVMIELAHDEDCESTPSSISSLPSKCLSYRPHMRLTIYDQYTGIPIASTGDFNGQPKPLVISINFEGERLYMVMVERMESGKGQFKLEFHSEVPISITN